MAEAGIALASRASDFPRVMRVQSLSEMISGNPAPAALINKRNKNNNKLKNQIKILEDKLALLSKELEP